MCCVGKFFEILDQNEGCEFHFLATVFNIKVDSFFQEQHNQPTFAFERISIPVSYIVLRNATL